MLKSCICTLRIKNVFIVYFFWATFFLALMVFILRLPATFRRIREQREALRPIEPVARGEHLPCIVNTIGAAITELALLGLLVLAVFLGLNAALGTLGEAPDVSTAFQKISLGAMIAIGTLILTAFILAVSPRATRYALVMLIVFGLVLWMVMSSTGDQWPAIALFGLISFGLPAIFLLILRSLF